MSRMTVCGLLAWVFWAGSAAASPMVGVTHINGHFLGMGGEFTLTPNAELAALTGETGPFGGFCMEWSEDVAIDAAYEVTVNREALQGGYNSGLAGPLGGDPLDPRTAYLYWRFRAGTLAGYEYTPGDGRALSAQALQDGIWYLEDPARRGLRPVGGPGRRPSSELVGPGPCGRPRIPRPGHAHHRPGPGARRVCAGRPGQRPADLASPMRGGIVI